MDDEIRLSGSSGKGSSSSRAVQSRIVVPSHARPLPTSSGEDSGGRPRKLQSQFPCTKVRTLLTRDVIKFPRQLEKQIKLRKAYRPLGISVDTGIYEGVNGCVITAIAPESAAERDGRLFVKDYIVCINNESMQKISPAKARSILRRVSLLHGFIDITYMSHKDIVYFEENFLNTMKEVSETKSLGTLPTSEQSRRESQLRDALDSGGRVRSQEQLTPTELTSVGHLLWALPSIVQLHKDRSGTFGIVLVGGKLDVSNVFRRAEEIEGLFVKDVLSERQREYGSLIRPGDRIIEVNGTKVEPSCHNAIIEQLRSATEPVFVKRQRLLEPLKVVYSTKVEQPSGSTKDEPTLHAQVGHVVLGPRRPLQEPLQQVEKAESLPPEQVKGAAEIEPTNERYKRLSGQLLEIAVQRNSPDEPIGLSLVGSTRPDHLGVFVCNIFPGSAAARCGLFKFGDEILEVNKQPLHSKTYANATPMIKSIRTETVVFLVHRQGGLSSWLTERKRYVPPKIQRRTLQRQAGTLVEQSIGRIERRLTRDRSYDESRVPSGSQETDNERKEDSKSGSDALEGGSERIVSSDHLDQALEPVVLRKRSIVSNQISTVASTAVPTVSDPNDPSIKPVLIGASSVIEIDRGNEPTLGITIVGGYGSHLGAILIHDILEGGVAANDGRLAVGDQILEVDGANIQYFTCEEVLEMVIQIVGPIRLKVIRSPEIVAGFENNQEKLCKINVQLIKKPTRGFGFSVMGRRSGKGAFVSTIIEGGCAEKDGRLMPGDFIMELNGRKVFKLPYADIVYMLKTFPPGKLEMVVGRLRPCLTATSTRSRTDSVLQSRKHVNPNQVTGGSGSRKTRQAAVGHKRSRSAPHRLSHSIVARKGEKRKLVSNCLANL